MSSIPKEGDLVLMPPILAFLTEGVLTVPQLLVGTDKNGVFVTRLSALHFAEGAKQEALLRKAIIDALKISSQDWEFSPSQSQIEDPLLTLINITDVTVERQREGLFNVERALDILHFRMRVAFSNYISLVKHQIGDGAALGVVINTNLQVQPILRPKRMVPPLIKVGYPENYLDQLYSKAAKDLTEVECALLNVLAWWRRSKLETDPTYKFTFFWIALESGMPQNERDEGAFQRRLRLLCGYPTESDQKLVEETPAYKVAYDKRDIYGGRKLKKLIKSMYRMRCEIVHDGSSHTSLSLQYKEIEQASNFMHVNLVGPMASLLSYGAQKGIGALDALWNDEAVKFVFSTEPGYTLLFLKDFDLDASRLFRW